MLAAIMIILRGLMINLKPVIVFLQQEIKELQAIYLFGSFANARAKADSDVDLAILANPSTPALRRWELATECALLLNRDVDLIDLRVATTILQYQIITEGSRVYSLDTRLCERYENLIMSEYLDFQEFRRPLIEDIRKRGSIYDR